MTDIERDLQERGAARMKRDESVTPRRDRDYDGFAVGDYVHFGRQFSLQDFAAFAQLIGDQNPLHHDTAYARASGFAGPIVPLQLAAAPLSAIAGMFLPGRRSLVLSSQLRALQPVEYGRPIEYSARIVSKHDAQRTLALQVIAFDGAKILLEGRMHVRVRADAETDSSKSSLEATCGNAFAERVALVTGATGEIGRSVALALARRGWTVILQGRHCERLKRAAEQCRCEDAKAFALLGDLADAGSRRTMIDKLTELPSPSAMVHAASPPIDAPLAQLFEVNYAALRELTESVVGGMLRRQHGRVLFIGSSAVDHAQPGWEDYVAAKQAAAGYVRAFDGRYSPYGLFGAVIAPGFVLGDFSQAFRPEDAECLLPEETAEVIVEELEAADRRQGGYLQLAPGLKRRGEFGFHQHNGEAERRVGALSNGVSTATNSCGAGVSAANLAPEREHLGLNNGEALDHWGIASLRRQPPEAGTALPNLVRRFFRLPNDASLAEAGLGVTPGWDSLGHLELLLHLESTLGLSFTSSELSRTTRYAELQRLFDAKRPQL